MASIKEQIVRDYFEENHGGQVPNLKTQQLFTQFMLNNSTEIDISYSYFNGIIKLIKQETGGGEAPYEAYSRDRVNDRKTVEALPEKEIEILEIGNMEFPDIKKMTTGTLIDKIFSDHDDEGGIFTGTANIIIGESGVGKSTVTLDLLAKLKQRNSWTKILYISSEMTRNDLSFYYHKMPIIKEIPTLLLMDYMDGRFDKTLETVIKGDYDVILIDSHQDIILKLRDVLGWKSTRAETWLTNLIIEAADKKGKTLFAIQHMTKGGQYVGSTFLKHATTSMMEIKFDDTGRRYLEFSKNRRGGSMVNKRLYYNLKNGEVIYDENMWNQETNASELVDNDNKKMQELESEFDRLFLKTKKEFTEDETTTETLIEDAVILNEDDEVIA